MGSKGTSPNSLVENRDMIEGKPSEFPQDAQKLAHASAVPPSSFYRDAAYASLPRVEYYPPWLPAGYPESPFYGQQRHRRLSGQGDEDKSTGQEKSFVGASAADSCSVLYPSEVLAAKHSIGMEDGLGGPNPSRRLPHQLSVHQMEEAQAQHAAMRNELRQRRSDLPVVSPFQRNAVFGNDGTLVMGHHKSGKLVENKHGSFNKSGDAGDSSKSTKSTDARIDEKAPCSHMDRLQSPVDPRHVRTIMGDNAYHSCRHTMLQQQLEFSDQLHELHRAMRTQRVMCMRFKTRAPSALGDYKSQRPLVSGSGQPYDVPGQELPSGACGPYLDRLSAEWMESMRARNPSASPWKRRGTPDGGYPGAMGLDNEAKALDEKRQRPGGDREAERPGYSQILGKRRSGGDPEGDLEAEAGRAPERQRSATPPEADEFRGVYDPFRTAAGYMYPGRMMQHPMMPPFGGVGRVSGMDPRAMEYMSYMQVPGPGWFPPQ
eukprot:CAMPEP_0177589470 /NCGR_PEP_ID=MMETSP0419_2-20121207/6823_1 /TAXON_ID=582737 /ORGANISM="Tetraselmis sp., Strain GSL018" /LENGTH=487 /DNA_ID=CAMNT_0019079831 /DNA_START=582 /DNA_END=2042 /DNA_ORIENTATION=-